MNIFQQRQFDRFARASKFIDAHSEDFTPNSQAIVLNSELKTTLASVEESSQQKPQETSKPKASASMKKAALNELREELDRIAQTAEALKKIDPDFKNTFTLPDKRLKDKLVSAAQQFQKDALPLKERFISFEMKPEFLDTLGAKLEAYKATQAPQVARTKGPKPKSADTSLPFNKASQLMEVISIVVKNKYQGDATALQAWEDAIRLNTPPRRRKSSEEAEAAPKPAKKTRAAKG
jgi:hypothetical protein